MLQGCNSPIVSAEAGFVKPPVLQDMNVGGTINLAGSRWVGPATWRFLYEPENIRTWRQKLNREKPS